MDFLVGRPVRVPRRLPDLGFRDDAPRAACDPASRGGRGGRPIEDVEAWSRIAWIGIKSVLWPIKPSVWLSLGKPGPGSSRRVSADVDDAEPALPSGEATSVPAQQQDAPPS